jgi:hypothetical protein
MGERSGPSIALSLDDGSLLVLSEEQADALVEGDPIARREHRKWSAAAPTQRVAVSVGVPLPRGGRLELAPGLTAIVLTTDAAMRDANERAAQRGGRTVLFPPPAEIGRILRLVGLRPTDEWYA